MRFCRKLFPLLLAYAGFGAAVPVAQADPSAAKPPVAQAALANAAAAQHGHHTITITLTVINNPSQYITEKASHTLVGGSFPHGLGMSVHVSRRYSSNVPTQVRTDCAGLYQQRYAQEVQIYQQTGVDQPAKKPTYAVLRYRPHSVGWINCHADLVVDVNHNPVQDLLVPRQQVVVEPDLGFINQRVDGSKRSASTRRRRIASIHRGARAAELIWQLKRKVSRAAHRKDRNVPDFCGKLPRHIPMSHISALDATTAGRATFTYHLGGSGSHKRLKTLVAASDWWYTFVWADGTSLRC
jgi:hypothetical protein